MAILNKYKKKWLTTIALRKDNYYDLVISHDDTPAVVIDSNLTSRCLINYIDVNKDKCIVDNEKLVSDTDYPYENAVCNDVVFDNIGFTGIDTSTVPFDKDTITQDEFIHIIKDTSIAISSGDTRLHLFPVSGNTKLYNYPCEIVKEPSGETYYKFAGGFLQGIYKACDKEYEVLPKYISDAWNLEFVIRPRNDYGDVTGTTINSIYPDNAGVFFYMGTRAENKFVEYYGCSDLDEKYPIRDIPEETGDTPVVETSEGHGAENSNQFDVTTDNGYLIYNRTCTGETTDTWKQGDVLKITGTKRETTENLYTLLNRTCTGLTTDTLDDYLKEHPEKVRNNKCNILGDLYKNAFALKINDDLSFGYKYLLKDCDNEAGFSVVEENGFPNAVRANEWNVINVMFKIMDGETDACNVPLGERKMKIYVYVNGYLKFISKELPEFDFRELNDFCDKQEGVAFNISLGGGTQGLMESVWFNKMTGSKHIFPLESNFAGSFIGDIRSFKFYNCQLQYNEINNNYLFEIAGGTSPKTDMVKNNILYYGFDVDYVNVVLNGKQMKANKNIRNAYEVESNYDDAHFYVVISKKYVGNIPTQFTCGGAPMVMFKNDVIIGGVACTVYESGEIYAPGTELLILSDNMF